MLNVKVTRLSSDHPYTMDPFKGVTDHFPLQGESFFVWLDGDSGGRYLRTSTVVRTAKFGEEYHFWTRSSHYKLEKMLDVGFDVEDEVYSVGD